EGRHGRGRTRRAATIGDREDGAAGPGWWTRGVRHGSARIRRRHRPCLGAQRRRAAGDAGPAVHRRGRAALRPRPSPLRDRRPALSGAPVAPSPRHLLLVDDGLHIGLLLRPHLEHHGYRVSLARTLADARRSLSGRDGPPDGLLLDLHLPDDSELELLRELRSAAGTRALPVMVLTAEGEETLLAERIAALVPQVPRTQVLVEPRAASTAPALAWAAQWISRHDPGAQMLSLHADWAVGDDRAFRAAARNALGVAAEYDVLVTVG